VIFDYKDRRVTEKGLLNNHFPMVQTKFKQAVRRSSDLISDHASRMMTLLFATYLFPFELSTSKYKRELLRKDAALNFIRVSLLLLLTRYDI